LSPASSDRQQLTSELRQKVVRDFLLRQGFVQDLRDCRKTDLSGHRSSGAVRRNLVVLDLEHVVAFSREASHADQPRLGVDAARVGTATSTARDPRNGRNRRRGADRDQRERDGAPSLGGNPIRDEQAEPSRESGSGGDDKSKDR
jgi:hypothetical protein